MNYLYVEVRVLHEAESIHAVPMTDGVLFIGRSPENDLILNQRSVSGRHAVIHLSEDGGEVLIRDLNSMNGTFVNDRQVLEPHPLADGDRVRLGAGILLSVHITARTAALSPRQRPSVLDDLDTGISYPVRAERVFVGDTPRCHVRIPGATGEACLTMQADGTVWVAADEQEFSCVPGQPLVLHGHRLVFRSAREALRATVRDEMAPELYPYELSVSLSGPGGPLARLVDPTHGHICEIRAINPVGLLFVLARNLRSDLSKGLDAEAGWTNDEEAMAAVWGRGWQDMDANNYQVLIFRTRSLVKKAGFEGWFIEKRRAQTRLRLRRVTVD